MPRDGVSAGENSRLRLGAPQAIDRAHAHRLRAVSLASKTPTSTHTERQTRTIRNAACRPCGSSPEDGRFRQRQVCGCSYGDEHVRAKLGADVSRAWAASGDSRRRSAQCRAAVGVVWPGSVCFLSSRPLVRVLRCTARGASARGARINKRSVRRSAELSRHESGLFEDRIRLLWQIGASYCSGKRGLMPRRRVCVVRDLILNGTYITERYCGSGEMGRRCARSGGSPRRLGGVRRDGP
jgi:hypothetical protein